ncbi:MAG: excinuclease ABC subunit UvrB [Bacteroidales bacterium]
MNFEIISEYKPTGDQPTAIKQLVDNALCGIPAQTLLGVTGSGKTFTMANVIESLNRPTLILSHNKTLAAQLYGEMKAFFPNNLVEYFVSYYDYYQPEVYLPSSDKYIEKDLSINDEIEKLRISTTSALLSGRRDVLVISSVSCLYGIGNPDDFYSNVVKLKVGDEPGRNALLLRLVDALYSRSDLDLKNGTFRVKGNTLDVYPAFGENAIRIIFWDEEIDEIQIIDPYTARTLDSVQDITIHPANIFVTTKDSMKRAVYEIQDDLVKQIDFFQSEGKNLEAERIKERVEFDMEMMKELGYCPGVENYSRYFDGRSAGSRPFCLLDYFPKDFMLFVDESHVTLPQIHAMYGGDRSRKINLVDYGFRLPAALDNRPLKFEEFEGMLNQIVYVSATPAKYELEKSEGIVVEQLIRPTGLLDPIIEVRPTQTQIDDLLNEISIRIEKNERVLVTTLTKRMSEELSAFLIEAGVKARYLHSDIDTLERIEILEQLRNGSFNVLVGINLLREGLDLPEVSLVAILDADKEGFLRSEVSMTQTAGRAARNVNGMVIMYADKITGSMQRTIDNTNYRREKQLKYNAENNITPMPIVKPTREIVGYDSSTKTPSTYYENEGKGEVAADPVVQYMSKPALEKSITKLNSDMKKAAKELDFMEAARLRDEMFALQKMLDNK